MFGNDRCSTESAPIPRNFYTHHLVHEEKQQQHAPTEQKNLGVSGALNPITT